MTVCTPHPPLTTSRTPKCSSSPQSTCSWPQPHSTPTRSSGYYATAASSRPPDGPITALSLVCCIPIGCRRSRKTMVCCQSEEATTWGSTLACTASRAPHGVQTSCVVLSMLPSNPPEPYPHLATLLRSGCLQQVAPATRSSARSMLRMVSVESSACVSDSGRDGMRRLCSEWLLIFPAAGWQLRRAAAGTQPRTPCTVPRYITTLSILACYARPSHSNIDTELTA